MLNWKPQNKKAAICFTIDDIHPAKSTDAYEAGGDLDKGVLGLVMELLERHPKLKVTLFTTASWREISPVPTRKVLASIPSIRDKYFLAKRWPKDKMNLENHSDFVNFLNTMERAEIAYHGLYHVHKGLKIPVEFQNQTKEEFQFIVAEMVRIFEHAGVNAVKGICPPGWNAPPQFLEVLKEHNFDFVASARDIFTPITVDAVNKMSGILDVPLLYPCKVADIGITHIPSNFQANSKIERARAILDNGGLLSIKAHIIKNAMGHIALDGVDEIYMNYLDTLLTILENEYGDDIWWTSMGEISNHIKQNN
ncbi:DUF2334 domain-containing protein [Ulvibacter antarcticus]|uniref:Uncharacterized protein DUF2334 n=1 Tax=Ulvibacter antarcticus TaxID=442714 RepID=A0A3L9YLD2_9FLAO|nr:DUF2334 domain-containing protein [Ulvibacter antarcticus]RMA58955.1 uncharacterized protein DUF2334 [Ulvibacter antarcticus]